MSEQPTTNSENEKDISDLVETRVTKTTHHRPDGKFLSNHEIAMIEENQDLIREKTPEKIQAEEDLKNQYAALKMEEKYPSDNEKVKPAIERKIAELQAIVGEEKTLEIKASVGLLGEHGPITKEQAVASGTYVENMGPVTKKQAIESGEYSKTEDFKQWVRKNPLYALASARLASIFSGASQAAFKENMDAKAQDSKFEGKKARAAVYTTLGAVGLTTAFLASWKVGSTTGYELTEMTGIFPTEMASNTKSDTTEIDHDANYNRYEQHGRDRMSTEGAFDGTERNIAELDNHVLAKIKNNPSLMAAVLEIRESGNKDANFSLADVNSDTRKFSVHGENGQYSAKGEDAVDTLERSWDRGHQGKLLSESETRKLMDKYDFINHGTDNGKFENALDNKMYDAGKFDYRPEIGDQIYAKKLGNGETVYFKVNEKDPTRDCLNVQTLLEKGGSTPLTQENTPGIPDQTNEAFGDFEGPDKNPKVELEPKKQGDDFNANTNMNDHNKPGDDRMPSGDQKPATDPGSTYTPPATPEIPTSPRSEQPSTPETGTPKSDKPGTGGVEFNG